MARPFRSSMAMMALLLGSMLSGCGDTRDDKPVYVDAIGAPAALAEPWSQFDAPPAAVRLLSTAQGLVSFDSEGQIEPGLAERWIVEEGGRSYIFRIRTATWPDGSEVTARQVARILSAQVRSLRQSAVATDLDAIGEIVAMTGQVIEIRLTRPWPNLLQALAQPMLAIARRESGSGPYRAEPRTKVLRLVPIPDPLAISEEDEDDAAPDPRDNRILRASTGARAIAAFMAGANDLVLGGTFDDFPLIPFAEVPGHLLQFDPVYGLFGLGVVEPEGFLANPRNREAIAMAIDRQRLVQAIGAPGWQPITTLVPAQFDLPGPPAQPRWGPLTQVQRQTYARAVVADWNKAQARDGQEPMPPLRIALPDGIGSRLLFLYLRDDLRAIGLNAERVAFHADADLRLIDEVAPYDGAHWYLGRVSCRSKLPCSVEGDELLHQAEIATAPDERDAAMAASEAALAGAYGYIPIALPLRWSLVGAALDGVAPSPRRLHPLNHLVKSPT